LSSPLDGLLVLSLEQAVAAPYCTSRLADAGARVIKVERAEGDFARFYDDAVGSLSSYFVWLNRGKQSLVADIKRPGDVELLHAILARADVFIQNLAPGAAARAGFGSETLRLAHPRLVTVDISGYGDGPAYSSMKAYDLLVQAESGLASITGMPDGPGRVGVSVCDIACGMSAHAAILEALIERSRSGRGSGIKLSLFDSIADWMSVPLLQYEGSGKAPARVGLAHPSICPYGSYATADGVQVVIAVQNEREWRQFCAGFLDDPDLATQPGYDSNIARVANRTAVEARVAATCARLTQAAAAEKLRAANTAFGCVNDLAQFARHPALRRMTVDTPGGPASFAAPPAIISAETCGREFGKVPSIGEHSASIRTEFLPLQSIG
jgi:crotonobetainyl-CoA:carnitine CoA-transferase CaiB-like acyl-CoA transferase